METWWNRTPFWTKRVLRNGRATVATVRFFLQGTDNDANPSWKEIKGELEVAIPGKDSVTLRGLFNGDRKLAPHVWPGTELPVRLHPDKDDKLAIDWKAWEQQGGFAAAQQLGHPLRARDANVAVHEAGRPTTQPQDTITAMSSGGGTGVGGSSTGGWQEQSIAAWTQAVASGHMSQAEIDQALADLRAAGG